MALDLFRKNANKKNNNTPSVSMKDIVNAKYTLDPLEVLGEKNFNEPQEIDESVVGSPVQEFFRDAGVFITGGTGFMGKILIEKLLRTCPHIKQIYLLIRPKKGKNVEQRLDEIFDDRLFKRLKHEVPKYFNKVSAISGDCSLPGLGLSNRSQNILVNEVNIIFHGAATVRFNEHIRVAMSINVSGVRKILDLARKITYLKAIAHISTAFANCNRLHIEEKFYTPNADYEEVLKLISTKDDQTLQDMTQEIIGDLPNTYTFTKSLGEDVIRREGYGLPVLLFRPTVVVSTYREPVRGWIDNVYGPIGISVGMCTGILHTYYCNLNNVPDLIPVDIAVNALICATKETATRKSGSEIPIYTCSTSGIKPITWSEFIELNKRHGLCWPTIKAIWYYSVWMTSNPFLYALLNFFCHIIPGYILDTLAVLVGQKPILLKIYKKIGQASHTLSYFVDKQWSFTIDNTLALWDSLDSRDQELFNFDINQLSWDYFSQANCLGLRVYLVKDDIHTLPAARKKWYRLYIAHNTLLLLVYTVLTYCVWTMIKLLLRVIGFA